VVKQKDLLKMCHRTNANTRLSEWSLDKPVMKKVPNASKLRWTSSVPKWKWHPQGKSSKPALRLQGWPWSQHKRKSYSQTRVLYS